MQAQQISVSDLENYWRAIAEAEDPGNIGVIYFWRLPRWNDICSELAWHTYLLEGGYFSKKHHGYCGVYRLFGLAAAGDLKNPATLNRALGQDTTGTLYIGKASWLHERLNQLRLGRHNAISALRSTPLSKLFPSNRLAVDFYLTEGKMRAFIEQGLIQAYMNTFGDTPPLNYVVNR